MNTFYTLKSGNVISVFMWDDFLENETVRGYAEVTIVSSGIRADKSKRAKLFKDEKGIYIVWESQKVYLNDFDYMPYVKLMEKVQQGVQNQDRWAVRKDDVWATFMKESEKVYVVCEMPTFDSIIPSLGFGITSDNYAEVLCVLSEKRYTKQQWSYKISLTCENEMLRYYVPNHDFYFSDFVSMLMSGQIRLVEKEKYIEEVQQKVEKQKIEDAKFCNRAKKFFKKSVNNTVLVRVMSI